MVKIDLTEKELITLTDILDRYLAEHPDLLKPDTQVRVNVDRSLSKLNNALLKIMEGRIQNKG